MNGNLSTNSRPNAGNPDADEHSDQTTSLAEAEMAQDIAAITDAVIAACSQVSRPASPCPVSDGCQQRVLTVGEQPLDLSIKRIETSGLESIRNEEAVNIKTEVLEEDRETIQQGDTGDLKTDTTETSDAGTVQNDFPPDYDARTPGIDNAMDTIQTEMEHQDRCSEVEQDSTGSAIPLEVLSVVKTPYLWADERTSRAVASPTLLNDGELAAQPNVLHSAAVKRHLCTYCGKTFPHRRNLNNHILTHTGEKPHPCTICGKMFREKCHLKQHVRFHSGEKPFMCTECGKTFTLKGHLTRHKLLHSGEKPYTCTVCGKSFSDKTYFKQHELFHTSEKPHPCTTCGKTFIKKSHLKEHELLHTGEKPHTCTVCGKSFTQKISLQKHELVHTGQKAHRCKECGKAFAHKSGLTRHMTMHTGENPHACTVCGKTFYHKCRLVEHRLVHEGEQSLSRAPETSPPPPTLCNNVQRPATMYDAPHNSCA